MIPPAINRRPMVVLVALTVLGLLAGAGYAARERPVWLAARETHDALAAGRFGEGQAAAERWARLRPGSSEAQYFRAKAALAMGRRRDFVEGLLQARALGHPESDLEVLQALVDAQSGRLDLARPVLTRAFVEATHPDPMVDEALARVLMELYDWPRAGAILARWAQDAPNDPRPPLWHATVHRRRELEADFIIADFREALRRDPNLAEARLGLAEELARAGKDREAAPEFAAYLSKVPDDPAGHLGAGRVARELGDLDTAVQEFGRVLELDPNNPEAHQEQARFDRLRGDEASALGHLDRAIALRPHDPAPRYNRKIALSRLGRLDDARQEQETLDRLKADLDAMNRLRERIDATPGDANLQSQLARWMFDHGYDQEALKWTGKILNEHPGHRPTCVLLAGYHQSHGNAEQAAYYQAQAARTPGR